MATDHDQILSDEEIDVLNEARSILGALSTKCSSAAWDAPRLEPGTANAQDYGRIGGIADVAEHEIFACLNAANAHHVREMTEMQLYNSDSDDTPPDSIIPPALVPVGHEDYPEERE